jgi:hypothetical protein
MTRPRFIPPALRSGSEEEAVTDRIFTECGGVVYSTSAGRATRSTPGISDKLIVFPNRRILLAWDDKAGAERYKPTDARRLSEAQLRFGQFLARGLRTAFGWGDAEAAKNYLTRGLR